MRPHQPVFRIGRQTADQKEGVHFFVICRIISFQCCPPPLCFRAEAYCLGVLSNRFHLYRRQRRLDTQNLEKKIHRHNSNLIPWIHLYPREMMAGNYIKTSRSEIRNKHLSSFFGFVFLLGILMKCPPCSRILIIVDRGGKRTVFGDSDNTQLLTGFI